ncbi:MAG: phospholipase D-like domain-containing protein, partial [Spirochaetaceae bacterium]|nr:phospholipase D-like domain-containing protein [Spirochaetaceae bacterium]
DILGQQIADILSKKAQEGIDVRLIFDGFGSLFRISRKYRKMLKAAGIKYHYFMDMRHWKSSFRLNYNNHKKIVVIDDKIGYLGGMNISKE